jgi:hypothetical protein
MQRAMTRICSAGSNRALEANYTERGSTTLDRLRNRSNKSGARNRLDLQLRLLTTATLGRFVGDTLTSEKASKPDIEPRKLECR